MDTAAAHANKCSARANKRGAVEPSYIDDEGLERGPSVRDCVGPPRPGQSRISLIGTRSFGLLTGRLFLRTLPGQHDLQPRPRVVDSTGARSRSTCSSRVIVDRGQNLPPGRARAGGGGEGRPTGRMWSTPSGKWSPHISIVEP
jgi:hypothetical protein